MDTSELLEELTGLLEQNGVEIRRQAMGGGGGGLCKIKGKSIFFVDTECSTMEMAATCAKEINERLNIESIYLKPQVRNFLEKYGTL